MSNKDKSEEHIEKNMVYEIFVISRFWGIFEGFLRDF